MERLVVRGAMMARGQAVRVALVLAMFVSGVGSAQKPSSPNAVPKPTPVDLGHVYGTWIGVSSAVTSMTAAIQLEDLVDGNPATAWNAQDGDLVGAWIDVHVAPTVTISSIAMTVGFTNVDAEHRDLFIENARIRKVRVTHDDKLLYDKVLDVDNRGVQELPLGVTGGVVRIEVLEVVRGKNPAWNQTCVSELRVWGTAPNVAKQMEPPVVVGTQRPPMITFPMSDTTAPCRFVLRDDATRKQLPPTIVAVESQPLDGETVACHVEATQPDSADHHTHAVFLVEGNWPTATVGKIVKLTTRHTITKPQKPAILTSSNDPDVVTQGGDVELRAVPLAPNETALLVDHTRRLDGGGAADGSTASVVFRATKAGLVDVLHFDSTWTSKPNLVEICELALGEKHAPLTDLDVECKKTETKGDVKQDTARVDHFRWNGSKYAKR